MKPRQTVRKRFNIKALFAVFGCAVALGAGVHFAHGYQVKRNARGLLDEASRSEQGGRPAEAADFLGQYVRLVPDDADARTRYALLLVQNAKSPRAKAGAYRELDAALRWDPTRQDVRREMARLAVALRKYRDARGFLADLRAAGQDDHELAVLQARCEAGENKFAEARPWYETAIEGNLADYALALEYAGLLRGPLKSPGVADLVVERTARSNPTVPGARLAAGRYFVRWNLPDKAEQALCSGAGEPFSDDADVLLVAAEAARERGALEAARGRLERGAAKYPQDTRFARELALVEFAAGRREQAVARLAPLLAAPPENPDELWQLGNQLIDLGQTDRAVGLAPGLEKAGRKWAADWLRGRAQLRDKAWAAARDTLGRCLADTPPPPPRAARHVHLYLAECHARLGNPDLQEAECRRALVDDPLWPPARRALALALLSLGRGDEAAEVYQGLAATTPEVRVEAARLLVARTLRRPAAERRWEEVEALLKDVPPARRPEAELLRAEVLLAQNKIAEAKAVATAERDRDPAQPGPWLLLLAAAEREGGAKAVLPLLDEAEQKAGKRAAWPLTRARYWLKEGGPETAARIKAVEEQAAALPDAERDRLLWGLGEVYLAAGDPAGVERVWRVLADRHKADVGVRMQLFDLAARGGHDDKARAVIDDLHRIEGPDGPAAALAEAALTLRQARRGGRAGASRARQAVDRAKVLQPRSPRLALLEAEVLELEGQKAKALEVYQAALDRGEATIPVVRKVVQLLTEQGKYADAQAALKKLPDQAQVAGGLSHASTELAVLTASGPGGEQSRREALAAAREAVAAGGKFADYLWLGQLALLADDPKEAEAAFRKARSLDESSAAAWTALVTLLSRTDAKKAEAELEAARGKVPAADLPRVLAVGYESLGKLKEALAQYQALAAAKPDDPAPLRDLAAFLLRAGDTAGTEQALRKLLAFGEKLPTAGAVWARRALAVVLARQGGPARFREADALLAENLKAPVPAPEDKWARVLALAAQPGRRREAIQGIEQLVAAGTETPADFRLILAQLYEADGKWDAARTELQALLQAHPRNPMFLAQAARALLRHGAAADAAPLVERLADLNVTGFEVVDLRARVRKATNRPDEAAQVVRAYLDTPGADRLRAAGLFDALGLPDDAERAYRAFAASSKDPAATLPLARHLGRRGRVGEALDLCEAAWKTCPPEVAAAASVAVAGGDKATAADRKRVEGWLAAAVAKYPISLTLKGFRGELLIAAGRPADAVAAYRDLLKIDPKNAIALNNLAYLLAFQPNGAAEALDLINAVIDRVGPEPRLLDTRAVVRLRLNRPTDALADLREAVAQVPLAAAYYHLALAHQKLGQTPEAERALRQATDLGFRPDDLSAAEQEEHGRLVEALAKK